MKKIKQNIAKGKKNIQEKNLAFLDGQNLYMGTNSAKKSWKIDFIKFRKYLKEKYKVVKAYYYIGYDQIENRSLYQKIQEAGFILNFREHNLAMKSQKKGNVDIDIVFDVMKKLYKKEEFNKIILVSGDGDYRILVDFLIEENRFEKILFPNNPFASSLYKKISRKYYDNLDKESIKNKIAYKKKKERP